MAVGRGVFVGTEVTVGIGVGDGTCVVVSSAAVVALILASMVASIFGVGIEVARIVGVGSAVCEGDSVGCGGMGVADEVHPIPVIQARARKANRHFTWEPPLQSRTLSNRHNHSWPISLTKGARMPPSRGNEKPMVRVVVARLD